MFSDSFSEYQAVRNALIASEIRTDLGLKNIKSFLWQNHSSEFRNTEKPAYSFRVLRGKYLDKNCKVGSASIFVKPTTARRFGE